jgi:DNA-binding transcriptional LysR family regulator
MFQKSEAALNGRIRVDMSPGTARTRVIPLLAPFLDAHPGLELELGATDRAVDLVREGYDCVVRVGAVQDSTLIARRVGELPLLNLASPGYLKRFGRPRTLEDLKKHQVVHYVSVLGQKPGGWEYFADGEWKELPMRGRVTVNNAEAYVAACAAGLGMIQCPAPAEHLRSGRLVEVLPRLRARAMPVSILYPHRRQLSRRLRAFMDWLEAVLKRP